jgi:ribose transport system ATP-binding protein
LETQIILKTKEKRGITLDPVLQIERLSKNFGGVQALNDVSLSIYPGEVHGLLGQNGSGKSTLIKVLSGFHTPDSLNFIKINGRQVDLPINQAALYEHGISFVHQNLGLMESLTVLENLMLSNLAVSKTMFIDWQKEAQRARSIFKRYDLNLDPLSAVSSLTPVERAQLAIIRGLDRLRKMRDEHSCNGLLVLDEPTPFLPAHDVQSLFKLIREIVTDGASVIFVSHDIDEVLEITKRVTVLRDGKVSKTFETTEISKAEIIRLIVGQHVDLDAMRAPTKILPPPSISLSKLTGGSVKDFNIEIAPGEIVGLTGLIGSGYDEIPYLAYGASSAITGTLLLNGKSYQLRHLSPSNALVGGCVLIPGDRLTSGAISTLSVVENISQPVLSLVSSSWALSRSALTRNTEKLIRKFNVLPSDPELLFGSLSGGNQQKALLAKWFQTSPRLILLDEPTQGVDVGARAQVFSEITQVADAGAAILCASSDYEQLTAICHRVLIFSKGKVVAHLTGDKISKSSIAQACYIS